MNDYKLGYNPKTKKTDREHRLKLLNKGINLTGKDVHHKNGKKNDNRLSNLEAIDHSKHTAITNSETHTKNLKCKIKGCRRKHYAKGLCKVHYNQVLRKRMK